MRWRRLAAFALASALAACGGSVAGGTQFDAGGATDGEGGTGGDDKCSAAGARICAPAASCPDLSSAACPGTGCTDVASVDGGATDDGVCWSDLVDLGDVSCASCDDGQACIRRGAVFRCVPVDVCRAFWNLGIQDVCVYADKHAYNGADLPPEPASCPGAAGGGVFCGGACGACRTDEAARCIGRSPDHPVGLCGWLPAVADPKDPTTIPGCSIIGGTYELPCPLSPAGLVCGVFSASVSGDVVLAKQYGLCMPLDMCQTIAASLPGGFGCYDATANRIAGQ